MKNYKNIVPIVLVVLFLVGIYMKYDDGASRIKEYNTFVSAAREYKEKGIAVDAETNYLNAIDTIPNVELYVEVGKFYFDKVGQRKAMKWGEEIVELYPNEILGYEFILGVYKDLGRYEDFFTMYDIAYKRGLQSETITGYVQELDNTYYFEGDYMDVGHFAEGYCSVSEDGLWGYVSKKGEIVTSIQFEEAGTYLKEVAPVKDKLGDRYFIDYKGNKKYIIETVSNIVEFGCYYEDMVTIYDGSTWGVYTLDGELKFGGYSDISTMANGVVAVCENGKWCILDDEGNKIIDANYDDVKQDDKGIVYRNDRLFVKKSGKYYLINKEGENVVDTAFEDVKIFNVEGYAAVKMNGKWGFIDAEGKVVIEPTYDDARSFSNGYAAVKKGQLWGYIDENGDEFLKCQFTDARDFTDVGSAFVKSGKWQLLRLYAYN